MASAYRDCRVYQDILVDIREQRLALHLTQLSSDDNFAKMSNRDASLDALLLLDGETFFADEQVESILTNRSKHP